MHQHMYTSYHIINHTGRQNKSLPVKIQGDFYSFDIAESEHDNQTALLTHLC